MSIDHRRALGANSFRSRIDEKQRHAFGPHPDCGGSRGDNKKIRDVTVEQRTS